VLLLVVNEAGAGINIDVNVLVALDNNDDVAGVADDDIRMNGM